MAVFIFTFIAAAVGAVATSIGCFRSRRRHSRPGWHLVLLGAGVVGLTTMLVVGGPDLFHPARWDDYKGGFWPLVLRGAVISGAIALLSSSAVVYYFRANTKRDDHVA